MAGSYRTAALAFETTLERLNEGGELLPPDEQERIGRRAARIAASEGAWKQHLGPLLRQEDLQDILGVGTRQAVHDLTRRHRILGLPSKRGRLYPAFQFQGNRPLPALKELLPALLRDASEWTVASWLCTAQDDLDGRTPAEVLRDGDKTDQELVKRAAERVSAHLGQ